jgi:hypothetical protein
MSIAYKIFNHKILREETTWKTWKGYEDNIKMNHKGRVVDWTHLVQEIMLL